MEDPVLKVPFPPSATTSIRPLSFVSSSPVPKSSTKQNPLTTGLIILTVFAILSFGIAVFLLFTREFA